MNRLFAFCLTSSLLFAACPKNVETNVSGSDDERMDQYSAQLEELRARASQDMQCDDWCGLKTKVCGISSKVCDISTKQGERADFQSKCVTAQEDCARFTDSCSSCQN